MGTVTIHETHFLEDVALEIGDIPTDDVRTTVHDGVSAVEAARILCEHGVTFAATGNDWAADPDGSYISNYATAERVETSGHLSGFPDRVLAAIMDRVG